VSHFARFDSLVEFDARSLPPGLATFNCDFVINDKVTNFRPRTLAGTQNRWGVEDIVRYLDDLLIVIADSQHALENKANFRLGDCAEPLKKVKPE